MTTKQLSPNHFNQPGLLLVVSAASGTGKTSLIQAALQADPKLKVSVSYTTRPKRLSEEEGVDYYFATREQFLKLQQQGEFIESAEVFGHFYGTSRQQVQKHIAVGADILLEIDWQGACQVRQSLPEAITIFVLPPSMQQLKTRLEARGQDSLETIKVRLSGAAEEISHYDEFDYLLINEDFDRTKVELLAIIQAEHARTQKRKLQLTEFLETLSRP